MSIARDRLRVSVVRLRWGCAAVVQRVGTPGVSGAVAALAGLALLAPVAIVVLAMKVIWIAPALRDAERRIAGCGAELRRLAPRAAALPQSAASRDGPQGYSADLGRIFDIVRTNGLFAGDVQYQLTRLKAGGEHLAVMLPLTGEYPDLRKALGELGALRGAELETVAIERQDIADAHVVAHVRLTLREDGR